MFKHILYVTALVVAGAWAKANVRSRAPLLGDDSCRYIAFTWGICLHMPISNLRSEQKGHARGKRGMVWRSNLMLRLMHCQRMVPFSSPRGRKFCPVAKTRKNSWTWGHWYQTVNYYYKRIRNLESHSLYWRENNSWGRSNESEINGVAFWH